jgi:hypothetical protein
VAAVDGKIHQAIPKIGLAPNPPNPDYSTVSFVVVLHNSFTESLNK